LETKRKRMGRYYCYVSILLMCCLLWCCPDGATAGCAFDFTDPTYPTLEQPTGTNVIAWYGVPFGWTRSNTTGCDLLDERYEVIVSTDYKTLYNGSGIVLCNVTAMDACNQTYCACNLTTYSTLQANGDYYWTVRFIANTTSFVDPKVVDYQKFTWCIPQSPFEPILIPLDDQNFTTTTSITFQWEIDSINFGESCILPQAEYQLYISNNSNLDGATPDDFLDANTRTVNPSIFFSSGYWTPGVWYWALQLDNGQFTNISLISNFTIYPQNCSCLNNGTCNTLTGLCTCIDPYYGPTCNLSLIQTQPFENYTGTPPPPVNRTGLIAGLTVGGGVVLIILAVLGFLFFRMKKKAEDIEMNIVIEPPDFGILAFEPYNLNTSPFLEVCSKKANWKVFEQLILAQDYQMVDAILTSAKITSMDTLCAAIVIVFESHGAGSAVLQHLMLKELFEFESVKQNPGNLEANPMPYRGDSAATKAFKVYCRLVGLPYLFETLGQILNDFCAFLNEEKNEEKDDESKSSTTLTRRSNFAAPSMEVDPSKMNAEEDETINRLSLQLICQKIFVKVYRSSNIFPVELRHICKKIREESAKVPSLQEVNLNVLLSNLVFLRFINPAIIVPKQFGLLKDDPSDKAKRQLVLVTKVLQNLAAGVEFGKKESFMVKLNDFIKANTSQMNGFLDELTDELPSSPPQIALYSGPISQLHYNASLVNLYEHIFANQQPIQEALMKSAGKKAEPTIKILGDLIREFGDPATYSKK